MFLLRVLFLEKDGDVINVISMTGKSFVEYNSSHHGLKVQPLIVGEVSFINSVNCFISLWSSFSGLGKYASNTMGIGFP
jgi:hypothetical protein